MKRFKVKTVRQLLDIEADWLESSGGLQERTSQGGFPRNLAHKVELRDGGRALYIMNTEGEELLFEVKE